MSECIFCRVASGELPAERVSQGHGWTAVRDVDPQAPVHVLVIPTEHVESLNDLSEAHRDLAAELLLACRAVAEAEGVSESGYRVVANTHDDGGQSVPHLHLHVLGGRAMRWPPG